jgi:hypothetical protein
MAVWPATLPQRVLLGDFTESAEPNVIRTEMETGPAKLRRRYTAEVKVFQASLVLTTAQVALLDTFYDVTVGAVDPFDWVHHRTLAAVEYRFRGRPEYRPLGAGYWRTTLMLEILP